MSSQKWEKCHRKQTKCWINDFERSTRRVPVTRWEKTATSMLSIFYEQECYDFVSNSISNKRKELQRMKEAAKLQKSSYELEDWKRWETICFACDKVFSASKSFFVCCSFEEWKKKKDRVYCNVFHFTFVVVFVSMCNNRMHIRMHNFASDGSHWSKIKRRKKSWNAFLLAE